MFNRSFFRFALGFIAILAIGIAGAVIANSVGAPDGADSASASVR